jgi:hypothetical protein
MKALRLIVVSIIFGTSASLAQTESPPLNATAPPSAPPQLSEADLEKLVAPIALYPDPLLATLLPASSYPLEIVQAGGLSQTPYASTAYQPQINFFMNPKSIDPPVPSGLMGC